MMTAEPGKVAVIVASLGRPGNLADLLQALAGQTVLPAQVILSLERPGDAPPAADLPFPVLQIFGPRGSCVQRNRGLDRLLPGIATVVFYDDDFIPSRHAIAGMARFFAAFPDVAGAHGVVLADGINGPGIPAKQARQIVDAADARLGDVTAPRILKHTAGLYGCNMAFRVAALGTQRFDEALPLYAWFEDIDLSARIAGAKVRTDAFRGVHCGEKRGRERNGRKLGYSQISNPLYLWKKGTLPRRLALRLVLRQVAANHLRMIAPEPWIDRRGRAGGNWRAILDALRGRADPARILTL